MERKCFIYKITSPTNRVYVGSTFSTYARFRTYRNLKCREQRRLYNSFVKHGVLNHKFEVICECVQSDRFSKEAYFGALYDVLGKNGLNCSLPKIDGYKTVTEETRKRIGEKSIGQKRSPETILKMSQWQIGRKLPESTKNKLSLIASKRKLSEETKRKIGEKSKGRKLTEEQKIKLSNSLKGRKLSKDHIEFIRQMNTGRKRSKEQIERKRLMQIGVKIHTEQSKKKISIANKGRVKSKHTCKKISETKSKLILNTENGIFYLGIKEAAASLNINYKTLGWWLCGLGKNKTSLIYA